MAFNGNFMCTSFKKELLEGGHDFKNSGGDTFKIALYTAGDFQIAFPAADASNAIIRVA